MTKRTIRRDELLKMVPLSNTTIYNLEKKGKFPARFALTSRCVVWDYEDVVAWLRGQKEDAKQPTNKPDVRKRITNPVRTPA